MPRHNHGPYLSDEPNPSGFFEIRWTQDGRSKRKSTGEGDRRRAQRVYAEFLLALDQDAIGPAQQIRVGQVIDAYLADKTGIVNLVSQRVTFGYLRAFFGEMAVEEIDTDDCRAYVADRGRGVITWREGELIRGGRSATPGTVRRELTMLSTAIVHCIRHKKFKARNGEALLTARHRPLLDLPAAPLARERWLTREEAGRLLAACQPEEAERLTREYRYFAMLLSTASREEPVRFLTWDRIDLVNGMINFQAPGRRLTKKRRGFVPISDDLRPILERAARERISNFYLDKTPRMDRELEAIRKRASLSDDVTPHVMRHTWATWAAQDGVPITSIAGVLHDSIATTERTYIKHSPGHLRSAVNRPLLVVDNERKSAV
jgi:integrase